MILKYNCINTVASIENGLVYSEWYFQYITLTERTIIKPIGLNVHKTPPVWTLCMYTVHKKLSDAHTWDFIHTK